MNTPRPSVFTRFAPPLLALSLCALPSARATDGVWVLNGSGVWSLSTNWSTGAIADEAGSIADFSQTNISTGRTVTIDTTSRTVGTILFGDIDSTHGYTIAASGGGTLTFNNSGSAAALTQGVNSGANTISSPVLLADSLNTNNNSASLLTLSGTVSASSAGTKTITNQGTGAGGVTLSGIISNGTGSVAVVQNSATSTLTLSGTNTFDTGVQIKQGTVLANNAAALGTGTVLLGDTSGSANATLSINSFTVANNITAQAGSTGTLTLMGNGGSAARPTGNIVLDNDLTLAVTTNAAGRNSGAFLHTTGTISGTQDLNLNVSGGLSTSNNTNAPQMDSLSVASAVTTSGAINNVGTGEGRAIISGVISNASSVNQNSATSMLTLSGANTYTGPTNVNAGILRIGSNTALPASSTTTVASGATLQLGSGVTVTANQALGLSGHGTAYSSGALEATNTSTYSSAIALAADTTVGSTLASNTLTLSGTITGSGLTLTTTGAGNHAISGVIDTGSGGLVKEGTGLTTLSGTNTYTGVTSLNNGNLLINSAGALGGGGNITFGGGTLRHSSSNETDLGSRITGSTGPISIDTNARTITYSGIDSSNTGGLFKTGTGRLTLSGTNAFSGPIVVNNGVLAASVSTALPSTGTGIIHLDSNGALNTGGAFGTVQDWLDSDNISTASTGAIALVGNSTENIDFTGYATLGLGASSNATYSGTITPAGTTYRLGGGGATLTLNNTDALAGANALAVNGLVILGGANNLSGATTVTSGTLTLNGAAGSLANSSVTVSPGATVNIANAGAGITRAASATLNRGTLIVTGNNTTNTSDTITGALTVGSDGHSTVTVNANASRNALLNVGSFARTAGSTVVIRGQDLGVSALASTVAGDANLNFTAPNLVGNGGTGTDRSIFVGVVGDISATGNGFGATGGLLTQDATNGVRRLSGADYKTSITDGQTALDNVQLTSASGTVTTTLASATTLNSLSLNSTASGANVQVTGAGTLKLNSGVIYANSVTSTTVSGISNTIDFNGSEGVIFTGGTANFTLSGVLSNTANNGLTVYAPNRTVTLSGASANTYTGTTTITGGTLGLSKTAGVTAITGDIVVNSGGTLTHTNANQIADSASITVNGGALNLGTETFNNLTLNGGSATNNVANAVTVSGVTTLTNGGTLTVSRSQNINGTFDSVATLGGGLDITNTSSGAYTAITIGHGAGLGQSGGKLVLGGNVAFTGNSTNTNTVLIDAIKGSGRQGVIELTATAGDRTFTIGNGAAATDLKITAALIDGTGASGLVKTGLGTLALANVNTYTGATAVNQGVLQLGVANALASTSPVSLGGGTIATGGFNQSFGTLDLRAASIIDLGSGTSALSFAASDAIDWAGSVTLSFVNFDAGADTLRFGTSDSGLTVTQLGQIRINGFVADIDSSGFLFMTSNIPEPSAFALLAGSVLLAFTALRRRRQIR